jgi:transposase-like protein
MAELEFQGLIYLPSKFKRVIYSRNWPKLDFQQERQNKNSSGENFQNFYCEPLEQEVAKLKLKGRVANPHSPKSEIDRILQDLADMGELEVEGKIQLPRNFKRVYYSQNWPKLLYQRKRKNKNRFGENFQDFDCEAALKRETVKPESKGQMEKPYSSQNKTIVPAFELGKKEDVCTRAISQCPFCKTQEKQIKVGKNGSGSQRYQCKICHRRYTPEPSRAYGHEVHQQAVKLYLDGSSFRGIARHLGVDHKTVMNWLKIHCNLL